MQRFPDILRLTERATDDVVIDRIREGRFLAGSLPAVTQPTPYWLSSKRQTPSAGPPPHRSEPGRHPGWPGSAPRPGRPAPAPRPQDQGPARLPAGRAAPGHSHRASPDQHLPAPDRLTPGNTRRPVERPPPGATARLSGMSFALRETPAGPQGSQTHQATPTDHAELNGIGAGQVKGRAALAKQGRSS